MSIIDTIGIAQGRGANADQIIGAIAKQNQKLAPTITKAQGMGADSATILKEIIKQNSPGYAKPPSINTAAQSFGQRVQGDVAARSGQAVSALTNPKNSDFSKGYQAGGATVGLAADVVGEAAKPITDPLTKAATDPKNYPGIIGDAARGLSAISISGGPIHNLYQDASNKVKSTFEDLKSSLGGSWDSFSQKHPEAAGDLQATIDAGKFAAAAVGGKQLAEEAPGAFSKLKGVIKPPVDELAQIQDTITPKPTVKQARLAQSEGRLIKGKEPTLFRPGTADEVLPSDKTLKATKTIQQNIPGAAKMNDAELYTALDNKTGEIAQSLKPEMQKVEVKPETVAKAKTAWEELKKSQIESADATEEANVKKTQTQFDTRLKKLQSKNATLDDWWQARKDYDASVPDNVKSANSQSAESLQNKKSIWLQNRGLLNDAINDSESGLGQTSRKAFSDMHDMYNAKEQLQSKAKIETKIRPSKISKFLKSPTGRIIEGVIGGGLVTEGGKKLITGGF